MFPDLFINAGWSELSHFDRQNQGIIPEILTLAHDGGRPELWELKAITYCDSRYIQSRAAQSVGEYVKTACEVDKKWCNTSEGAEGPVERRLL